uniref:Hemagglutinin n=1 Tax=Paraburkholderia sprentiae WSM5005 TaxID=754502 RepID=A0A1I9YM93_9BURK
MVSLSTSASTGIASLSTSASTGLSTIQSGVTSLSTGLSTTNSSVTSLSTSTSTSLSSLSTGVANAVQYDDPSHTKVTLGGAGSTTPVTLTNVADGVNPTDAVNFGQLTSLSTSTTAGLNSLSTGLSTTNSNVVSLSTSASTGLSTVQSGMTSLSTGLSTTNSNVTALSTSTSTGLSTVQSGMTSLSTGLSTTNSSVASLSTGLTTASSSVTALSTGIANGTVGLVQQAGGAPGNGVITVGAHTGGTSVDFTGTSGARQLTGVAAGTAPTDAVNVSQLQAVASVASDAVLYDSPAHNSVTLGGVGAGSAVTLTNIAAGKVSATSTDAINGSQLFALETQISTLGSSGLGAQVPPDQQSTVSSTPLKGVAVNSSEPASATGTESAALGGNSTASGSKSVAVGSGATASGPNSVALGAGSVASEPDTVSIGSPGHERTLTNVAPGVNPTDAVNMSQLNSVQQGVNALARQAYSGIAGATALTMIPEVDPGKTLSVGIGSGNYKGYSAVAIGFTARITDNLKLKGGVSTSSSGTVYGAGIGYQW